MAMYDADFWEKHHRTPAPRWATAPNETTVSTIHRLITTPGDVLELGAGHCGDPLWLAGEGWTVTTLGVAQTTHAPDLGPVCSAGPLGSPTRQTTGPGGQRAEVANTIVAMRWEAA